MLLPDLQNTTISPPHDGRAASSPVAKLQRRAHRSDHRPDSAAAPINPGNSGGALVDLQAFLHGISCSKETNRLHNPLDLTE